MKNKIIGIFVCLLLITTGVVPIITNTTKAASFTQSNDAAFDLTISFLMKIGGLPSLAACIIKDDQMIWSKGYGYYDRAEKKPATTDTIYVIASVTKPVVGTAFMQLYEQGLFDLDDDVNTVLPFDLRNPNFPDDPITFRMLLSHTSSLNENLQDQYYWFNFSGDPPFSFFPEPYLREFLFPGGRYYDPDVWSTKYRPGEHGMYANIGFDIISYLVELISGEPFLKYCDTHIFSPLDMKHTGFNFSRFNIDQVAIPYQRSMGRYNTLNELYGGDSPLNKYWRMRFYPAGGLYTTVNDLSHFLIAHMNDGIYNGTRILKKETVELMHTPQPENQIYSFSYGLAWLTETMKGITVSGHEGDLPGAETIMLYNQTDDIGVIYLANGNPHYGYLLFRGAFLVVWLFYLLYTKKGTSRGEIPFKEPLLSDVFLKTSSINSQLISYRYN